jgi:hypothetical protein
MKPVHSCDHRPILAQDSEVFQSLLNRRAGDAMTILALSNRWNLTYINPQVPLAIAVISAITCLNAVQAVTTTSDDHP